MDILAGLNPAQHEAVTTIAGPLLIVAGPGSGKTRVITHRVAYLIKECGVRPFNILAVTFTNKAAREMKERLYRLVGETRLKQLSIGTFHAQCAVILRKEIQHLGQDPHFVIYDEGDQIALVRRALKDLHLDEKQYQPRAILHAISTAKSESVSPEEYLPATYWHEIVKRVYRRYQELLLENKALDFDDLLMTTVRLFREHPAILQKYQDRYVHVLVDEFQDTNITQYLLIKLLAGKHRNICVVGDPDQSIYRFRSADIRNILNFERDYPDAKVVLLEQNYRSTQIILDVAQVIIAKGSQRKEKKLWTKNDRGVPVVVYEAYNEQEEGDYVVREIMRLVREESFAYHDVAVMYRTNAQSRAVEDALVRLGVPYRLVGATRFYERKEIKDVLAYLRLIHNPYDNVSLMRIINVPMRGLGARTTSDLERWATGMDVPIYTALQLIEQRAQGTLEEDIAPQSPTPFPFGPRAVEQLINFLHLIDDLISMRETTSVVGLLDLVLEKTGYATFIQDGTEDGKDRWANVQELRSVARQYEDEAEEPSLAEFLEGVALVSDVDNYEEKTNAVTLLTLHSANGLEFPVVFIIGMEEGLLPHANSLDDP